MPREVVRMGVAGRLTVWGAADLRDELLSSVKPHTTVEVELAAQDEIDVAGLQVLVAAANRAEALEDASVVLSTPSEHTRARLESMGVEIETGKVRPHHA